MKRKIFSWFKYGAFVLFVVIACTELASQIYVAHYRTDLLRIHESEENTFETKRLKDWKANFKRSPYFGYVTTYGNNYGFSSSENYPITRYENTYVIAVLGGSVADYFVRHVIGHNELTEKLKQLVPSLKDRDIQFMNLAIPGYKQPQQYFAMSYFIEHIDLVIQIDGWNEVWSRTSGAYPMDYPTFSEFLYNDQSLEKIEEMIENKKLAETIRLNPILSKSKTMLLFRNIILKDVYGQARELTSNQSTFYTFFQDNQTIQGFLINNWKKYTQYQQAILKLNNKPGFFFLQPSQYNPDSKVLSDEERPTVINEIFKNSAEDYQLIRKIAPEIGVRDLAMVFKNETGTIYVDDCCHVNAKGNDLLAMEIFKTIGSELNKKK